MRVIYFRRSFQSCNGHFSIAALCSSKRLSHPSNSAAATHSFDTSPHTQQPTVRTQTEAQQRGRSQVRQPCKGATLPLPHSCMPAASLIFPRACFRSSWCAVREIVHIQAGQCGNQVSRRCRHLRSATRRSAAACTPLPAPFEHRH